MINQVRKTAPQVVAALLLFSSASVASALDIIWVSEGRSPALANAYSQSQGLGWVVDNSADTTPYDQGWIDLLTSDGHTVDYRTNASTGNAVSDWETNGAWQGTLSQTQKDDLTAADLVIISPDFNGLQYNPNDTGRLDWNAIETPLMSLTPQPLATDIWWWSQAGSSFLRQTNLLDNDANPPNSQPLYLRTVLAGSAGNPKSLRSSNDAVQFDLLDENMVGGSQVWANTRSKWDEPQFDDGQVWDWSRLFATTGDIINDDTMWEAPTPDKGRTFLVWDLRWDAGQQWCEIGCDPSDTPPAAGPRQVFIGAMGENPTALRDPLNPGLGTHYVGAGVESFTPTGEAMFLDYAQRLGTPDNSALQKNRAAPMFTPVIDGAVTANELASQLRVPMTVAREGVAPQDQLRGGTVLESSNAQNGVLRENVNGTCDQCGFDPAELSGDWYVSWDADNLYMTSVVKDNSPNFFLFQDEEYVFDASALPHDGVGFFFNPNNDLAGGAKSIYQAAVETDDATGPSILRNQTTTNAQLTGQGVVIEGQQTTDGDGAVDGYVLEMLIPWDVAMTGAGGNSYVPAPGDEHGLSFILSGWDGFDFTASSRANHKGRIIDFGFGESPSTKSPDHPGLNILDHNIWNLITLAVTSPFTADFDFDGDVDEDDLAIFEDGYGAFNGDAGQGDGDADGDGFVRGSDFLAWQQQLGSTINPTTAATVPEPTALPLLAAGLLITVTVGDRRRLALS
ncbi:hypothetical protein OAS39_01320 [Pirellulales bacterium]|nr:hypothetical protein [Pirellulales bacterium]